MCIYHCNGDYDDGRLCRGKRPDEDALGLCEFRSMKRHQQGGDGKFARGIGEQLQGLRVPYIRHRHFNLRQLEAFNVPAETPMDGVGDQNLAGEPKKLYQVTVSGQSFSSNTCNLQALIM